MDHVKTGVFPCKLQDLTLRLLLAQRFELGESPLTASKLEAADDEYKPLGAECEVAGPWSGDLMPPACHKEADGGHAEAVPIGPHQLPGLCSMARKRKSRNALWLSKLRGKARLLLL